MSADAQDTRAETTQPSDYPALFRTFVARSLDAALAAFDPAIERLDETLRERGLHALSYGLRLEDAWPATRELALSLAPHLERQGYRREWMAVLAQALAQAEAQRDNAGAAHLHLRLGRLHILQGDYAAADAHLAQAQRLAAAAGDNHTQAQALERLGLSAFDRSDLDTAQARAHAALALVAADDPVAANGWHLLGWVALRQDNAEAGIARLQQALAINRLHGRYYPLACTLRDLGTAYLYAKRHALGVAAFTQAIELFTELGDDWGAAVARMNLGVACWYQGDHTQALAAYAPCEAVFQRLAGQAYLARLYNNQGLAYRELGEIEHARALFAQSIELARGAADWLETANALDSLAGLHLRLGDSAAALNAWQEALTELARLPAPPRYLYNLIRERMAAVQCA
ncbi:MAG: tetratricopeptide repeat protein [Caldilineaceae bacterium]|nr:tetratricopeptide repeat protein [Caldilineaceae bacterium]